MAFAWIFRSVDFHRVTFLNSTNEITGNIYEAYGNSRSYFMLRHENEILQEENALLRQKLLESYHKVFKTNLLNAGDTTLEQAYQFIPARVIQNTVTESNNYFTLNIGSRHGAKEGMGVIGPEGIVGAIKGCSPNFSVCISVLNTNIQPYSVQLKKSGVIGNLFWDGNSPEYASVKNIPTNMELEVGDTLETSGYSKIFPEGIPVGTIAEFEIDPRDGFYVIKTKLATNFYKLGAVYAVDYVFREELDAIQDSLMHE